MKRFSLFSTVVAVLLLSIAIGNSNVPIVVASASAQVSEQTSLLASDVQQAEPLSSPRHCIISHGKSLQCFETEAEALRVASGGRINMAPGQTSASLTDDELFGVQTTVRSILYEHTNYGGATLTVYGDTCYGWNNMPVGWNDVASSLRTDSCGITLYEHNNMTGPSVCLGYPGSANLGSTMNDKASSWSVP